MMVRVIVIWVAMLGIGVESYAQSRLLLENEAYRVVVTTGAAGVNPIVIERLGTASVQRSVSPVLTVCFTSQDPQYGRGNITEGNTPVAAWRMPGANERNIDLWQLGEQIETHAITASTLENGSIRFGFERDDKFSVSLTLSLAAGSADPVFSWELLPAVDGWFSVGLTALQAQQPENLDFLYQPLVWSWKRFPAQPVLTPEAFATTAAVFTNYSQATEGLAAHPGEIPYRFATFENSRFGFALRTANGGAKPMIFAPVLGGEGSAVEAGNRLAFSCVYFLREGNWETGVNYLYGNVLNYRNERRNTSISLNQTFENMVDYAMNDFYSGWVEELKGSDYRFDVPGTVKNVSALHPLSVALTTGNIDIYRRRAIPMIAYLMSREKYLYAVDEEITQQNPSHFLKGPSMEIAELASLDQMTGFRNIAFSQEVDRVFGTSRQLNLVTESDGETWWDYLAKYRMDKTDATLQQAIRLADEYLRDHVDQYPDDFTSSPGLNDRQASFVTDYTNRWYDLIELYEETGYERYLAAAAKGARQMLLWMRSNPLAPDSTITVNAGNRVAGVFPGRRFKLNSYDFNEYDTSTEIQEQEVEAWRTSLVGLPPEAPSTYRYGPVMLTHHAPWMLRLAQLTGDSLFRDAAYNAVIGRYANFPGYYFTSFFTTVYQQEDYPLHPYLDVKYNAIFYNHIWPHIAFLQDFLISDAFLKSGGQIDFPSAYAVGYAFLTSKVYGHKPGRVFDNEGVYPWLPKRAFTQIDPLLNHVLGRSEEDTYAVLMNTSDNVVKTTIELNQDVVKWNSDQVYDVDIYVNGQVRKSRLEAGKISVEVPSNGLIAFKIHGLRNDAALKVMEQDKEEANPFGYFRKEVDGMGTLTGMSIGISDAFTEAYVYTDATAKQLARLELRYRTGDGDWETLEDTSYPFEFSWRMETAESQQIMLRATDVHGNEVESEVFQLGAAAPSQK